MSETEEWDLTICRECRQPECEHDVGTYTIKVVPEWQSRQAITALRKIDLHAQSKEWRELEPEEALLHINDVRNSIIGLQTVNWSEHIYPLVAALNAAGLEGMDYLEAKGTFGTMLTRLNAAEKALEDGKTAYLFRKRESADENWSAWALASLGITSLLFKAQDYPDLWEVAEVVEAGPVRAALAGAEAGG